MNKTLVLGKNGFIAKSLGSYVLKKTLILNLYPKN